jgi:hypothetical protein
MSVSIVHYETGAELTSGATLREAIEAACRAGVSLAGADLIGADLRWAYLIDADLTGAILAGASLTGATLRGANLDGASLIDADLTRASLYGANLTRAIWSRDVAPPAGWLVGADERLLRAPGEMIHYLKIWPAMFDAVMAGRKTHEIRNADRGYSVGDVLILNEWDPVTQIYTGASYAVEVTFLTLGGECGLPIDTCVMSIRKAS